MMRRKFILLALFTLIFQLFFSTSNTLSFESTQIVPEDVSIATEINNHPNNKCESASIDEFPPLFFTDEQRRRGGFLLYIVLILYSFAAIEIVCDDYFASALERISCNFNLTPDVAGATFMALATSASEFFTSMVGVFFVKSDIALGTIVGSAVFNVLFVIALCALISTTVCELDAYPIVRDAGFYCIAVAVLYIVIYDQRVFWYEALALVLLYFVYVGILKFNDRISRLVRANSTRQKSRTTNEQQQQQQEQLQVLNETVESGQNSSSRARSVSESLMMSATGNSGNPRATTIDDELDAKSRPTYRPSKKRLKDTPDNQNIVANATEIFDPLKLPSKRYKIVKWLLMYPVRLLMHITIPDCRKEVFHNYYMLTFVMSTIWVAGLAYLLVWLVVIVGYTLHIRDSIMGLTVLAFGSSIEEIFSAIVMTRRGHPEMAIAGSIGSNVFDILMGLGIPWLFRNLMRFTHQPTTLDTSSILGDTRLGMLPSTSTNPLTLAAQEMPLFVEIHSRGLVYSTIVLFVALLTFLITFFINRCRLTKLYGVFLIVIWLSVITLMCLFELNIFGVVHAEPCRHQPSSSV